MRSRTLLILLLLAVLLTIIDCQGGGGGGGRGSSRGARRAQRQRKCRANCQALYANKPKKLAKCLSACSSRLVWFEVVLKLGVLVYGVYSIIQDYRYKKRLFQDHVQGHTKQTQCYEISKLEENQRIEALTTGKWQFTFWQKGMTYLCRPHTFVREPKEDSRYLYKFSTTSNDEFGDWKSKGYLGLSSEGITIWMMKNYDKPKKAGQTGKWRYLLYKGVMTEDKFEGKWWFDGFENDAQYSGKFILARSD